MRLVPPFILHHSFLLRTFSGKFGVSYKRLFPLTFKIVNLN